MKRAFYKEGNNFLMVTGECPKGFEKLLFVTWEGEIDSLKEGVKTQDQLKQLEKIDAIPDEWLDAFVEASGFDADTIQKVTKRKARASASRRDTPLDEFVGHLAVGTDPVTAAVVSGLIDDEPVESHVDESFNACLMCACVSISFILYLGYLSL
jgi:hypothetical protein